MSNKLTALECDDTSCEHWPREGGSLYCSGEVDFVIEKLTSRIKVLEDGLKEISSASSEVIGHNDIAANNLKAMAKALLVR